MTVECLIHLFRPYCVALSSFKHRNKTFDILDRLILAGNFKRKLLQFRFSKSRYRYANAIIAKREIARSVCPSLSTMFMIHSELSRSVVVPVTFHRLKIPMRGQ